MLSEAYEACERRHELKRLGYGTDRIATRAAETHDIDPCELFSKGRQQPTGLGCAAFPWTSDLRVVERYIIGAQESLDSGDVRNAPSSLANATDELQLMIRDIEYGLKTFGESRKSMAELKIKEAGRQVEYLITWLNREAKPGVKGISPADTPPIRNNHPFLHPVLSRLQKMRKAEIPALKLLNSIATIRKLLRVFQGDYNLVRLFMRGVLR